MAEWVIDIYQGKFDIRLDRRAFAYDLDDLDEAIHRIRTSKKYTKGDRVVLVEEDGYRTRVM